MSVPSPYAGTVQSVVRTATKLSARSARMAMSVERERGGG